MSTDLSTINIWIYVLIDVSVSSNCSWCTNIDHRSWNRILFPLWAAAEAAAGAASSTIHNDKFVRALTLGEKCNSFIGQNNLMFGAGETIQFVWTVNREEWSSGYETIAQYKYNFALANVRKVFGKHESRHRNELKVAASNETSLSAHVVRFR